ncbi:S-layer homology domain-containing protein [Candidatus Peregrinibacteria bacterium]|nr:MAG: S-layer homology domain-containing protein [Candidatus Peregrinibacteria bacterium]
MPMLLRRCFIALFFGVFLSSSALASTNYSDLYPNDPVQEAVDYLTEEGIVEGYSDGTFRPMALINRAEFTKMIVEGVLGETPSAAEYAACFVDVGEEWFAKYVCRAKELEWVEGYGDGRFAPGDNITRAEAMKILAEALEWELLDEDERSVFLDNQDNGQWYWDDLLRFEERELVDTLDSYISPHELITRKQMSLLLHRALTYEEGERPEVFEFELDPSAGYEEVLDLGLVAAIPSNVDFVHHSQRGWPYGCYSFATKTLVQYKYGEVLDIAEVQDRIAWDGTFIWSSGERSRFAAEYGYDLLFSYNNSAEFFFKKLALGEPLVLYIPYYSNGVNIGHQLVAYSFDADGVWVADSLQGGLQRHIPYSEVFLNGANFTTNLTEYRKVKSGGEQKMQSYL